MIIIKIKGGLGNQLYQYVFARYIEENTNQKIYYDISSYITNKYKRRFMLPDFQVKEFPKYKYKNGMQTYKPRSMIYGLFHYFNSTYNENEEKFIYIKESNKKSATNISNIISPGKDYFIEGYFTENYYGNTDMLDMLVKEIVPKKEFSESTKSIIDKIRSCSCSVAVHIRQKWNYDAHGKLLYEKYSQPSLSALYYKKEMERILYSNNKVDSFIVGDDIKWAKENIPPLHNCQYHFISPYRDVPDHEDLFLITHCNYHIISSKMICLENQHDNIMLRGLYSSESVSRGHPDKVCDQISDRVLDYCLNIDPKARVACEVLIKQNTVVIAGEISSKKDLNIKNKVKDIAIDCLRDIGYDRQEYGFFLEEATIYDLLTEQSDEIAMGVDNDGAGDQGSMIGYATNEHPSYLPLPIAYSHKLMMEHHSHIQDSNILLADAKCQTTIEYNSNKTETVHAIVFSAQHTADASNRQVKEELMHIITKTIPSAQLKNTKILINPAGRFVKGGPLTDTGLTGRKIIVDTYGNLVRHGGGALSGKDPTKVDRSAAYLCRYLAKNIVKCGIAKRCEIQISYAIGVAQPVSIVVDCFGTATVPEDKIEKVINELPFLSPSALIDKLKLARPIYEPTSYFGHFGREHENFTWEKLDLPDYFSNIGS